MALVWAHGETIVLVKRSPQDNTELHVVVVEWDHSNDCFVLNTRMLIPVAANAEILTGGSVVDSETGLFQSYLVFAKTKSIYICGLDFDQESHELVARLELTPPSKSTTEETDTHLVEDCWIVDGPTVVAVWSGQLFLITSNPYNRPIDVSVGSNELHCEVSISSWEAHVLAFPESNAHQPVKLHFCGDVTSNKGQEVILSVTESTGKRLRSLTDTERYLQSWFFYSLDLEGQGAIIPQQSSHPSHSDSSRHQLRLSKQIPSELEPSLITCMQAVAAVSSPDEYSSYIFIGTSDRRLLKCRHGQILNVLHLDATPSQLLFGVVAEGQGVLLVVHEVSVQKVSAVCPESLQLLQDWSEVWKVVVGDFTSSGHDQIILLDISSGFPAHRELCSESGQRELNFTVVHGFSAVTCEGTQEGSQQHLAETKVINDSKVSGMETICKALHERVEAGLEQLKVVKHERDSKKELVRISSCLMQNLVTRWAFEARLSADGEADSGHNTIRSEDRLELVRATSVRSRICGLSWFLMVDIEMTGGARSDTVLRNVSLLVTSLNGSIGGKASVVQSLSHENRSTTLLVCIPLREFSLLPGLPLHVSLRATLSSCKEPVTPDDGDSSTHSGADYTQWLGESQVVYPTSAINLQPEEAYKVLEQVGEQVQFTISAKGEEQSSRLSEYMQSALRMREILCGNQESSLGRISLCSADGHGLYSAFFHRAGLYAVIKILSRMIPYEALEKVGSFVDVLKEQFALQDSLSQKGQLNSTEDSRYQLQKLQRAVDAKFSDIWSIQL